MSRHSINSRRLSPVRRSVFNFLFHLVSCRDFIIVSLYQSRDLLYKFHTHECLLFEGHEKGNLVGFKVVQRILYVTLAHEIIKKLALEGRNHIVTVVTEKCFTP